jgi:uncharacterized protein (DUF302 family)
MTEITFQGVRLRHTSDKPYDALVAALFDDVGATPVPIEQLGTTTQGWSEYDSAVSQYVGPSGFMLFGTFDHGGWIGKAGIDRKVLRVIIGNPLIAITMIRHDVTAGLFAPVELLITDEPGGGSALTYLRPSSLMVVEDNPPLLTAARELDAKLAALIEKVTG